MIPVDASHVTPIIPDGERANRQRCTDCLDHLRVVYRHLQDAGVVEQFREVMTKLALDIKAVLGNEKDGLDG